MTSWKTEQEIDQKAQHHSIKKRHSKERRKFRCDFSCLTHLIGIETWKDVFSFLVIVSMNQKKLCSTSLDVELMELQ